MEFSQAEGIACITLNRPEKRNALNDELLSALLEALERTGSDESVRVVLIRGAGRDFCAGMDIALLSQSANAGVMEHLKMAQKVASVFQAMRKHPRPLIAAVQGRALGGGAGIATACDIVLAEESAQFGYPEVKIGFVPAIVMALLRRSVGRSARLRCSRRGIPSERRRLGNSDWSTTFMPMRSLPGRWRSSPPRWQPGLAPRSALRNACCITSTR